MLYPVTLTALRPLCGDYGRPDAGDKFTTDDRTAESLMARGLAERYREPGRAGVILTHLFKSASLQAKTDHPAENKMLSAIENKSVDKNRSRMSKAKREYLKRTEPWLSRA